MTQEDIDEVMVNSLKRWQLEHLVFDGGNIESAKRLIRSLQAENAQLKAQLTWRPVSEKLPSVEKDGDAVIGRYKDLDEGLVQFGVVSTIWFLNNYESWFTHWLPIPPAPDTVSDGWEAT